LASQDGLCCVVLERDWVETEVRLGVVAKAAATLEPEPTQHSKPIFVWTYIAIYVWLYLIRHVCPDL